MRARLDAELVRRGLARSRQHAVELIEAGEVAISGATATKPATMIAKADPIVVQTPKDDYVSRGGHKLAGALQVFKALRVEGRDCLDAGASTGGFTDVLLRAGAKHVTAVDVGYGQLAWSLQTDPRVTVIDRTNVRTLTPEMIDGPKELTVADLSFIPLHLVLPALTACTKDDLVPMVKPQFEVGKERLGSNGVVREPALRAEAITQVAGAAQALGWGVNGVARSPLPGPAGNVEFFLWLRRDAPSLEVDQVQEVVAE